MKEPRVLLVRFSAIGDVVMAAWAATAIRQSHPQAFLGWCVEERCSAVVDTESLVQQKAPYPRERWKRLAWTPAMWREQSAYYASLRRARFEVGVDLQGHSKTALCLRLSGAKQRLSVGGTDALARRLNPVASLPSGLHTVERNLAMVAQLGYSGRPERPILPNHRQATDAALARLSITLPPRWVAIAVSAGHPSKAYPQEGWTRVAELLQAEGFVPVWLGGPSDVAPPLAGCINTVGRLSLDETMGLVARSPLVLASDTGAGHLAGGYGVPVVSIFGPTEPQLYRPFTSLGHVLRASERPGDVSADEVVQAGLRLLSEVPRA